MVAPEHHLSASEAHRQLDLLLRRMFVLVVTSRADSIGLRPPDAQQTAFLPARSLQQASDPATLRHRLAPPTASEVNPSNALGQSLNPYTSSSLDTLILQLCDRTGGCSGQRQLTRGTVPHTAARCAPCRETLPGEHLAGEVRKRADSTGELGRRFCFPTRLQAGVLQESTNPHSGDGNCLTHEPKVAILYLISLDGRYTS